MIAPSPSSQSRSVVLIGAGGHARVVASSASRGGIRLTGVLETASDLIGAPFDDLVIEADQGADQRASPGPFHAAVGSNAARRAIVEARPEAAWLSIIDPAASLAAEVMIGDGTLIGMGAVVQTGVSIGRHAIINSGAIIDHDCRLGDFVHVAPGAVLTGGIQVGAGALIGAGAVILPGLSIGEGATVGAGAVVTRAVANGQTVVGNPARPLPETTK